MWHLRVWYSLPAGKPAPTLMPTGAPLLMRLVLQLELPADARLLPMTRRTVGGYLEDAGIGDEERADLVLAVDEACANVVRHAFPGNHGRLRVMAEITDGAACVHVEDDGVGFDPAVAGHRPGLLDTSGRGLRIIRTLMTSVALESPTESGGTRVVMRKDRAPAAAGVAHDAF